MPLETLISTKWRFRRRTARETGLFARNPGRRPRLFSSRSSTLSAALLTLLVAAALTESVAAIPAPAEAAVVRTALDQLYRMDYAAAEETLNRGLPAESPARPYFAGVACMNRFLDWGDTIALRRAESHWENLSPRGDPPKAFRKTDAAELRLYRGLAGVQLSFAASLRGQRFRTATLALAARNQLDGLKAAEARATVMLYEYYRGRILEKLPFVGEADFDVAAYTDAIQASPALREMLLASLFWIHVDHRRFGPAQSITAEFLARYPENRLMRQMRADAFFQAGKLAEARDAYERLRGEYAALPPAPGNLPLGYFRSVGNLARIQAARGDRRETEARVAEWNRAERLGLMPWLPAVLKRDVARL